MILPRKIARSYEPIKRKRLKKGQGIPELVRAINPNNYKPGLNTVANLMVEIDKFVVPIDVYHFPTSVPLRKKRLASVHGKRSAEEIAMRQRITVGAQHNKKEREMIRLSGCHAESLVLQASLAHLKVPSKIFRYIVNENGSKRAHSIVVFRFNDKVYSADIASMSIGDFDKTVLSAGKFIKPIPFNYDEVLSQRKTGIISKELILEDQSLP